MLLSYPLLLPSLLLLELLLLSAVLLLNICLQLTNVPIECTSMAMSSLKPAMAIQSAIAHAFNNTFSPTNLLA